MNSSAGRRLKAASASTSSTTTGPVSTRSWASCWLPAALRAGTGPAPAEAEAGTDKDNTAIASRDAAVTGLLAAAPFLPIGPRDVPGFRPRSHVRTRQDH